MVNPYDVIMLPWITEKAMEARTSSNRLEFIVRRSATKADIVAAVEALFDAEVDKVNVRNTKNGKLASVKLLRATTQMRLQCDLAHSDEVISWAREHVHSEREAHHVTEWRATDSQVQTLCHA